MLLRLGSGVFVDGYKISIVEDIPEAYAVYRGNGKRVSETAVVGARPAQPIELYEFEGCPFCRKARIAKSHILYRQLSNSHFSGP